MINIRLTTFSILTSSTTSPSRVNRILDLITSTTSEASNIISRISPLPGATIDLTIQMISTVKDFLSTLDLKEESLPVFSLWTEVMLAVLVSREWFKHSTMTRSLQQFTTTEAREDSERRINNSRR